MGHSICSLKSKTAKDNIIWSERIPLLSRGGVATPKAQPGWCWSVNVFLQHCCSILDFRLWFLSSPTPYLECPDSTARLKAYLRGVGENRIAIYRKRPAAFFQLR